MGAFNTESSFGLSSLIAGVTLLVFCWFTFMGLDYLFEGNPVLPAVIAVTCGFVLGACLVTMCVSKRTRNRRSGAWFEVCTSLVALVIIVLGSVPFMKFLSVIADGDDIRENVNMMVEQNRKMILNYHEYAVGRINDYELVLSEMQKGELPDYSVLRSEDVRDAREMLLKSLKRRLLPQGMGSIEEEREEWLSNITDIGIWNPLTPMNVKIIAEAGRKWSEEYEALSRDVYVGEESDTEMFEDEDVSYSYWWYRDCFAGFTAPSWWVVLITLLCYVLILLPYISTRRSRATFSGTHGGWSV